MIFTALLRAAGGGVGEEQFLIIQMYLVANKEAQSTKERWNWIDQEEEEEEEDVVVVGVGVSRKQEQKGPGIVLSKWA